MADEMPAEKSRSSTSPVTIIVVVAVIGLLIGAILGVLLSPIVGLPLGYSSNPLARITSDYVNKHTDSLLSVQQVKGENAETIKQQIITYCPDFDYKDYYYLAQIDNAAAQKSLLFVIDKSGKTVCTIDRSAPANATQKQTLDQNLLATINGEPVYVAEVSAVYNNIPAESRTNTSLQEALDQVIGNKLLIQDAAKKAINVEEEEIDTAVNTFLTNNGLTLQQLEERLTTAGSSVTIFRNNLKNNLLLQKEVSEVTKNVTLPTEAEIQAYYDANK
ncbi:MAG TPA: SurA N-terminal domain-containing protein, partial [Candidatus Nanoarchaeia archaeon]|nr:SurA N-terminal domain-containing protein [Candidatus Nanoarchaeia archaeon]